MAIRQEPRAVASVVIPAHNEARGISRLLKSLLEDTAASELEIIVVCNGCTDDTAARARQAGPTVLVAETPIPSKRRALDTGDELAHYFPRIYVDADVEISGRSIIALIAALEKPDIHAVGPSRVLPTSASSWLVTRYLAAWQQLPAVRNGLFGRGVVAVDAIGYGRVSRLPHVMSDDLAMSEAFSAAEREIVSDATVVVQPPRRLRDLLRRRIRVHTGNSQFDDAGGRSENAKTSLTDLVRIAFRSPGLALDVGVFLAVTVMARIGARRTIKKGDYSTWLRDESSRAEAE
ncbi:MAG TPA: glycosyltransferase [Jatrophihabitans sp.]|jgi:glycosyltransferase involved in cell wall biosynthesis